MKREEAFALHMGDLFNDCVNNHTGLLRMVADRLPPDVKDDVQGSLKEFLMRQVELLQRKRERATADILTFVGGEAAYRRLRKEDWENDCKPTAEGWQPSAEGK